MPTSHSDRRYVENLRWSATKRWILRNLSDGDLQQREAAETIREAAGLLRHDRSKSLRKKVMVTPEGRLYLP